MRDNELKFSLPELSEPQPLRLRFCKIGNLRYISHLDLQRTFGRVLVRAGLPLYYTKGFNPHIKMVFGLPLPVGCESECEFLDLKLDRRMDEAEVLKRLNESLTCELSVREIYIPENAFSKIAFAAYTYRIITEGMGPSLADRIRQALDMPSLPVIKHGKSGDREVNFRDFLQEYTVNESDGCISVSAVLAAGEGRYINPLCLLTVLKDAVGILSGDPLREGYRVMRDKVLLSDGVTQFH